MKIVITGGPCSGKTTVINELRKKGYFVMEEVARKIISEKRYSKHLNGHKDEALQFQLEAYDRQIDKEKDIDKANDIYPHTVFLDRGHIDVRAYCKHLLGYTPEEILNANVKRYDTILVLERMPLFDDNIRRETEEEAEMLHDEILQEYIDAGYNPIIIPVKSVKERIKQILEVINKMENRVRSMTSNDKILATPVET